MEAYFPRKALAMPEGLFGPGVVSCSNLEVYRLQELRSSEHLSVCQQLLSVLVLTRTRSGCTTTPLVVTSYISIVLITWCTKQTHLPWLHPVLFAKSVVSTATSAKLDSLEMISGAAFRIMIIGLTNIPKNWISSARLDLPSYLITVCMNIHHTLISMGGLVTHGHVNTSQALCKWTLEQSVCDCARMLKCKQRATASQECRATERDIESEKCDAYVKSLAVTGKVKC